MTPEEGQRVLQQEEYDDESAMLKADFHFRMDSLPGTAGTAAAAVAAAAVVFLTLLFGETRSPVARAICLHSLWLLLVAVSLLVLSKADFKLSLLANPAASPSSVGSYECEARS